MAKLSELLEHFGELQEAPDGSWLALCPVHEGAASSPSLLLSVSEDDKGEKRLLVKCRIGCDTGEVLANVGLGFRDLFRVQYAGHTLRHARSRTRVGAEARSTAAGLIHKAALAATGEATRNADGEFAAQLRRRGTHIRDLDMSAPMFGYDPDEHSLHIAPRTDDGEIAYIQRRLLDDATPKERRWLSAPNVDGGSWDAAGWMLPRRLDAPVIVTEGPGDGLLVSRLGDFDVVAVRGVGAANRLEEVGAGLTGREVIICFDADDAGRKHAPEAVAAAHRFTTTVKVLDLGDGDLGDLYETLDYDLNALRARLMQLIAEAPVVAIPEPEADYVPDPNLENTDHGRAQEILRFIVASGQSVAWNGAFGWLYFDERWTETGAEIKLHAAFARLAEAYRRSITRLRIENNDLEAAALRASLDNPATESEESRKQAENKRRIRNLDQIVRSLSTASHIASTIQLLRALPGVATEVADWNANPHELPVANGIVDLRTGKLRPATPADRWTLRSDTVYDEALAQAYFDGTADSGAFDKFLDTSIVAPTGNGWESDDEKREFLRVACGYATTGNVSSHLLVVLAGPAGTGKSTFASALQAALGTFAETVDFGIFTAKNSHDNNVAFTLAQLVGKRLIVTSEANSQRVAVSTLKQLAGGDAVSARKPRQQPFTYIPAFTPFWTANDIPSISDPSEAAWQRVRIVTLPRPVRNTAADDKLLPALLRSPAEQTRILAWAVSGARTWYERGGHLPESKSIADATKATQKDQNPLVDALEDLLEHTGDENDLVKLSVEQGKTPRYPGAPALMPELRMWFEDAGEPWPNWSPKFISRLLRESVALGPAAYDRIERDGTVISGRRPAAWRGWRLIPRSERQTSSLHVTASALANAPTVKGASLDDVFIP